MKTVKKAVSLFLALLVLLSFGAAAEQEWSPIATSPNGLKKGEYFLDFSKYYDVEFHGELLADLSAGTWYIDVDAMQLKATGLSERAANYFENSTPGMLLATCLDQAGIEWIPVAKEKSQAKPGGWFFDADAAVAALVAFYAEEYDPSVSEAERIAECRELVDDFLANYTIAVNPGDKLLRYQVTAIETNDPYQVMRLPVYHATNPDSVAEAGHTVALEAAVQQLEAPKPASGIAKLVESLRAFFQNLIRLFFRVLQFGRR